MGHATHFLSRLERLELPETELALSLYRDTELLREVLQRARIPEQQERIAIGLRREEGGPHLVVSRDGGFVTCLGPRMALKNLAVISRNEFDGYVAHCETVRERMALADSLVEPGQKTSALIGRIVTAGHALSREEYLGISAFAPLMVVLFTNELVEYSLTALRYVLRYSGLFSKLETRKLARERKLLEDGWTLFWAVGHLAALVSEDICPVDRFLFEKSGEHYSRLTSTYMPFVDGMLPVALRAMTIPARLGQAMLPEYVEYYERAPNLVNLLEGAAGQVTIAIRDEAARPLVLESLGRTPKETPLGLEKMADWRESLPRLFRSVVEDPAAGLQRLRESGAALWSRETARLAPESSWRPERTAEGMLEELQMLSACSEPERIEDRIEQLFLGLTFVAQRPPEELYLPAAILQELEASRPENWAIERTANLLKRYLVHWPDEPARVEHKAKPNDRCPCGSGKKYKRCCMGAAEAEENVRPE